LDILILLAGLVILIVGAELLVRSASRLASAAGISPLVIGLTVVAFGTGSPELVIGVQSVMTGQSDVALGNVLGSNIFNVLFILGLSALIIPLQVSQQLIRFDVPLMVLLSCLVWLLAYDEVLGRYDGLFFVVGLVVYTVWAIIKSRKEEALIRAEYEAEFGVDEQNATRSRVLLNAGLLIVGLGLLILGSHWFVDSAVSIARQLGVSELVIGLTIVALGTSLPEVATSVMAAIRGERDIAVGNVVGSNLFNIMGVLGVASVVSPVGIPVSADAFQLDIPVMVATAVACLPIFFTGNTIARWEGALFFGYYCAYTAKIAISAAVPSLTRTFTMAMFGFVIPLTVITLGIGLFRALRDKNHAGVTEETKR